MTVRTPGAGRLVGLDVARCVALLGMVATHVLDERDVDGSLSLAHWVAGGRASALFALLAGVSVALAVPTAWVEGRSRDRVRRALVVRTALIALVGLLLGQLDSGLAVILTYYGVLFLLGLPFLRLGARWLIGLGAVWVVAGPVLSMLVRPELPARRYANPILAQLEDPWPMLSELLFTGYYPTVPWLAYLLVGMGVGRLPLARRRVQLWLVAIGALLAVGAVALSDRLVAIDGIERAIVADGAVYGSTADQVESSIEGGMGGTTPTGTWAWLLVHAPHSATPFDLATTIGSALLVLGVCLLVVGLLPAVGRSAAAVLFGAGTMTLTLYSLHVVLRSEGLEGYRAHVLVLLGIGAVYAALGRRGPLERVVAAASRAARRPAQEPQGTRPCS